MASKMDKSASLPTMTKKALPFKRSAARLPSDHGSDGDDDGLSLFQRRNEIWESEKKQKLVEDAKRKRGEKFSKDAKRPAKRHSESLALEDDAKRPRLSTEDNGSRGSRESTLSPSHGRGKTSAGGDEPTSGLVDVCTDEETVQMSEKARGKQKATTLCIDSDSDENTVHPRTASPSKKRSKKRRAEIGEINPSDAGPTANGAANAYESGDEDIYNTTPQHLRSCEGTASAPENGSKGENTNALAESDSDNGPRASAHLYQVNGSRPQTPDSEPDVIEVDDYDSEDDDDDEALLKQYHLQGDDLDSEEEKERAEFLEFIRQAQRRQRRQQTRDATVHQDMFTEASSDAPRAIVEDPIILIFVTSVMPGCGKPAVIKRRISQNMKAPKDAWVAFQSLAGQAFQADDVFLTWKLNRVNSFTTGITLGLCPDGDGKLGAPPSHGRRRWPEDSGFLKGGLHLQAWTQPAYDEFQRQRDRERRVLLGIHEAGDDDQAESDCDVVVQVADMEKTVRIILKARDLPPFKLAVRPTTMIEQIQRAYCSQKGLDMDKVAIHFDGEVLELDTTIADAEIDDMDNLEVHVK